MTALEPRRFPLPEVGTLPKTMYASIIRRERYGRPDNAFQIEKTSVPALGPGQVLVYVMAAGINYNNVWAAMGKPVDVIADRQRGGAAEDFHIGGSEGSGIVWAVGDRVRQYKVGDPVVLTGCAWDESAADIRLGADPMTSASQKVWGYEANFGSFAQFTVVEEYQCIPKPDNLTWEEAACYMLTGATAYRQLAGWPPHVIKPGDPVLIWGGGGGLGSMAIQITRTLGGIPIAVVSSQERAEHCMKLGAKGTINRTEFKHWGRLPDLNDEVAFTGWLREVRRFGQAFWKALGARRAPKIVFEHSGEQTMPTSMYVCDNAGMVVTCGGSTGYAADVDLRFLWMRQKRLQGSHFANLAQCHAITHLVAEGHIDPCLSWTGGFDEIGKAHQMMADNRHPPGNMAVLINAPRPGLKTLSL